MDIRSIKLNELLDRIEQIRRRKIVDYDEKKEIIYIDPNDNISKLKLYNNHLIFGRRGSGKTTLLLAVINEKKNDLSIIQDSQILRKLDSYRVITNILVKILEHMESDFLDKEFDNLRKKYCKQYKGLSGLYYKVSTKRDENIKSEFFRKELFIDSLRKLNSTIYQIVEFPNEIQYKMVFEQINSQAVNYEQKDTVSIKSELTIEASVEAKYKIINSTLKTLSNISANRVVHMTNNAVEETKTNITSENIKVVQKSELLNSLTVALSELFNEFYKLKNKHIVLYLDDFYLIPTDNQPFILQYLHDVYKNCQDASFCFKVCSLPYRLRMNEIGEVNFSYKDDFSPVKLDNDFSQLEIQTDYLLKIACAIKPQLQLSTADIESLFNNREVLLYSVVATGGIPRDFLLMLADLIKTARSDNSSTILKQHVYKVINALKDDKDNNIEYDSEIDPEIVRNARRIIEEDIVEKLKTNVILYPSSLAKRDDLLLKNLVNLRYLHVIRESTSSQNRKKEDFAAYLIDMIFYATNKRMPTGFRFRRFWEKDGKSRLREIDSAPIWSFPEELAKSD